MFLFVVAFYYLAIFVEDVGVGEFVFFGFIVVLVVNCNGGGEVVGEWLAEESDVGSVV